MIWIQEQVEVCKKLGLPLIETPDDFKVGISLNIFDNVYPINGLRHPIVGNTSGWYIWAGEYSLDPDFFIPIHASHLIEKCPLVTKYLGLPPGWRFQIAPNYEDIWHDNSLLDI